MSELHLYLHVSRLPQIADNGRYVNQNVANRICCSIRITLMALLGRSSRPGPGGDG
jgi:hypothetical protein